MSKPSSKASRKKKKRDKGPARKGSDPSGGGKGGAMQSLVGGFRAAVGVGDGKGKKSKVLDRLLWAAVLVAAVVVIVYRCG